MKGASNDADTIMAQLDAVVRLARHPFIITFSIDCHLENPVVSALLNCAVRFTLHDGRLIDGIIVSVGINFFVYAPDTEDEELESVKFDDIKEVMYL